MTRTDMRQGITLFIAIVAIAISATHAQQKTKKGKAVSAAKANDADARNAPTGNAPQPRDPEFAQYGIYEQSAPRPAAAAPIATSLPLDLKPGDHIAFIGNTLFERAQLFGHIEALLHQDFPRHQLVVRNLSWSADTIDQAPRPAT